MKQSPSWKANWYLQLDKKFLAFYGTLKFITVLTNARHLLRDTSSRNTPPPEIRVPSGGAVDLRIVLSPEEASRLIFLNMCFHGEALLAPHPTPKVEDHPLSAVRDCLFNLFAATLQIGGRSSIRNLGTRHFVVTGTDLSHGWAGFTVYNTYFNVIVLRTRHLKL
jgi:hypothetical protein